MLQFTTTGAGDCYGPRYLYTWILPVALFIAAGAEFVEKHSSATVRWIWIIMVCMMAIANGISVIWNGYSIRKKIIERSGVYHLVAANGLHRAVVFLRDTDFYTPNWYTRNGINYRGDVVYVFDLGARKNERLRACYPDYHFYQYRAIGSNRSTKAVVPYCFRLNADED